MSIQKVRINEKIIAREVRLIDIDGTQAGVISSREALARAAELGVDLVEIAPTAKPPVCRLMDYGKFLYQQTKKNKENRKRQTIIKLKEVTFSLKIEKHDFEFKKRHMIEFLERGDKVKIVVFFRGREVTHLEFGRKIMDRLKEDFKDLADVEKEPDMEGRRMIMVFSPKPKPIKPRDVKSSKPKSEAPGNPVVPGANPAPGVSKP